MHSMPDDRTLRAVIRDEALRLFAARGADAVSVRQIAAAAGVSPGLVVHHFGSKDGLRAAVDRHVLALFDGMLSDMTAGRPDFADPAASGSATAAILAYLPPGSAVPAYLRRLLLDGSEAGREVFARMFELSLQALETLAAAGLASTGQDPPVRAAFLLANDLAVLLLRERLADVLGVDPLSGEGLARWAGEILPIYGAGLAQPAPGP